MLRFKSLSELSGDEFTRKTGLPRSCFLELLSLIESNIEQTKQAHPLKRRGCKSALKVEDKLLLTLYYLRHYPTFDILADMFSVSSSYANDIYHQYSSIMVNVLHVEGAKSLKLQNLETILIDVTEQPIERPKKGQKAYYSGKKTAYHQGPASGFHNCFNHTLR